MSVFPLMANAITILLYVDNWLLHAPTKGQTIQATATQLIQTGVLDLLVNIENIN